MVKATNVMNIDEYQRMVEVEDNHWWYRGLRRIFNNLLKDYAPKTPLKILDAGCGTGGNLPMLEQFGEVVACDISPEAARICQKQRKRQVVLASILELPFTSKSFDLVTSFDVMCCLDKEQHQRVILEFKRVLKTKGVLMLNLPAYNWLFSTHDRFVGTKHRFNASEIFSLLSTNGFEIQRISYWDTLLFPALASFRLAKKKWFKSQGSDLKPVFPLVNNLLRRVLFIEAWLLKYINLPFGLSVLAVARKT